GLDVRRPSLRQSADGAVEIRHEYYGQRWLYCEGTPQLLFTNNETNLQRLYGQENLSSYVKDGINDYIVHGKEDAVNPAQYGTKVAAYYPLSIHPAETVTIRLRFTNTAPGPTSNYFTGEFDSLVATRQHEAEEFYATVIPDDLSPDARNVMRQSLAGMLWSKQFYHYDVSRWLRGDPNETPPPAERLQGRNHQWEHLFNADVISMPDKWEYPWYAAWDLAFHCLPLAL